jgi:hypothetical protein
MKLPVDQMPTRLYILTDMQFNAVDGSKVGALSRAREKFTAAGYAVPEIVCWNLKGGALASSMCDRQPGCCTISGFTTAVLSSVMKGSIPDPYTVMKETLTSERYERLDFPGKCARQMVDALVSGM